MCEDVIILGVGILLGILTRWAWRMYKEIS